MSHITYCSSVNASDPDLEHCLTNCTASICLFDFQILLLSKSDSKRGFTTSSQSQCYLGSFNLKTILRFCMSCPFTRRIVNPGRMPFNAALLPDVT